MTRSALVSRRGMAAIGVVGLLLVPTACAATDDPAPAPSTVATAEELAAPTADAGDDGAAERADIVADPGLPPASEALALLGTLDIKGRAPKTGYDRALFGQAWTDDVPVEFGHNGCDTRNDILTRDLTDVTYRPGTRDCVVTSGTLDDPYTGTTIAFVRGETTSSAVQIDHVVALSDAWQKGAQQLDTATRTAFANDPRNLRAVDGPTNQQKGDGDAATWLPPDRSYRCEYVSAQVEVKAAYRLWVTQAEHDAIAGILASCGPDVAPAPAPVPAPAPAPAPVPEPAPAPAPADTSAVYFPNCAAARAAGVAPVHAGSPGYGTHLDRDGDGIGCE
ncbi:DUF1524 domain-containing protein [Rhodococcus rhodnii]|uniref:Excalibur calcium-binding domain-containing protein n=2 Tax=Rhodococcus rhodnii TaxID=38312 RepID=R7WNF6_9NOCA|nr:DUF1524 domain-containing protein [Rhodococcus rhodnii]EOM76800.1 hypothetical protein Rrhod_1920 [Rhodococcus rhodnii LMG 5362]TXG90026.1 DUF1524 domain-containing protein [Rhodococcus rhodnii]